MNRRGTPDDGPGVELRVEALASDGRGVARRDGVVWFVPGGLPGDRVRVDAVRRRSRYVVGRVRARLEDGPGRRVAPCPYQDRCGGCPWMPLSEGEQRSAKERRVRDALERIAAIEDPPVDPVVPSPSDLRYRNKVEFVLGRDEAGREVAGLHVVGGSAAVDVDRCLLQSDRADRVWAGVREALGGLPRESRRAWWAAPAPVRVVVRTSRATGRVLVGVRATGPLPGEGDLAAAIVRDCPGVSGVVRLDARPGRRGGMRERVLAGDGVFDDAWLGTTFPLRAGVFFQVNPGAADLLGARVVEAAGRRGGRRVLDLYGGSGAYAWWAARGGDRPIVVEADPHAVACGRAARGGADVAPTFHRADVGRWLRGDGASALPDLVIANPPRTGMGGGVAAAVAALRAPRVIVVSCDPATLARDLRAFLGADYRVDRVTPIDLFPQTPHVETVTALRRDPG